MSGGYTTLDSLDSMDDNIPDQYQEEVVSRLRSNPHPFPVSSDNSMLGNLTHGGDYNQEYRETNPTISIPEVVITQPQTTLHQHQGVPPQHQMNPHQQGSLAQRQAPQEPRYNPSPYLSDEEKRLQVQHVQGVQQGGYYSADEPVVVNHRHDGNTCIGVDGHIKGCSICSKLHAFD